MSLDPATHVGASRPEIGAGNPGCIPSHKQPPVKEARANLANKVFTALYEFTEGHVYIRYPSEMGDFFASFKVSHSSPGYFSEQLDWIDYTLTKAQEEPLSFNLGRNLYGLPKDPTCDHFPYYTLYSQRSLEHFL
ncbi:unnamed protein product [Polarella glacialis]|uniref:Uncharacterized protein n=1 Tax=Polarella glacialis TaxID=89957 RepID=A0A813HC96_POLGL|nr:unnamed protein product [Polarella glacialis]